MKKRWLRWLAWIGVSALVLIASARLPSLSPTTALPVSIPPSVAQETPALPPPPPPEVAPAPDTPVTSPPLTEPTEPINPEAIVPPVPEPTASPTGNREARPDTNLSPLPLPAPANEVPNVTPLPVANTYIDANARFRVGIVQGYRVSPLAGSVLLEAPDGTLAYTVVVQPLQRAAFDHQPLDNFALAQVAQAAFARGEGFTSTAIPVDLPTGGVQVNWSGTLTIAGQTQPVQGVILARQTGNEVLLLLIAGAQAGIAQVPNAVAALVDTFQPLL